MEEGKELEKEERFVIYCQNTESNFRRNNQSHKNRKYLPITAVRYRMKDIVVKYYFIL